MSKKVWWVVGLVLVIVLCSSHVLAVDYGFKYYQKNGLDCWAGGGDCCQENVDNTFARQTDGFKTEFFSKFTDSGFTGNMNSYIEFSTNDYCMGDNIDEGDKDGVFAYGYLYTLDTLTQTQFRIGSRCTDANNDWKTRSQFSFYTMSGFKDSSSSLKSFIKDTAKLQASCGNNCEKSDDADSSGMTYNTCTCGDLGLSPGYYFVAIGLVGEGNDDMGAETIGSRLDLFRFNDETDSVYGTSLNRIANTPRYIVSKNRLTPADLNTVFGSSVETTPWLCEEAGGTLLTDLADFGAYKNTDGSAKLDELAKLDSGVSDHICCGDDGASEYYIFVSGSKNYRCANGVWDNGYTSDEYCKFKVTDSLEGNPVFESSVFNNYNTASKNVLEFIDEGVTASDGCCGDDFSSRVEVVGTPTSMSCTDFAKTYYLLNSVYDTSVSYSNGCSIKMTPDTYPAGFSIKVPATTSTITYGIWVKGDGGTIILSLYPDGVSSPTVSTTATTSSTWSYITATSSTPITIVGVSYLGTGIAYASDLQTPNTNTITASLDNSFISSSHQYLCLDRDLQATTASTYRWLNAANSGFKIQSITGGKTTDVISNGKDWYYCNANKDVVSENIKGAIAIPEYDTFASRTNSANTVFCSDIMSALKQPTVFTKCPDNGLKSNCCLDINAVSYDTVANCDNKCFNSDNTPIPICSIPGACPKGDEGKDISDNFILKTSCADYADDNCLTDTSYDLAKSCSKNNGVVCADTQECLNGKSIPTSGLDANTKCCFGEGTKCVDKDIKVDTDCTQFGGVLYTPATGSCQGTSLNIDTGKKCCINGADLSSSSKSYSALRSTAASSFICIKQEGNNIISDCCYDSACPNKNLILNYLVSESSSRVQSLGSATNTLNNFDHYVSAYGVIVDYVQKSIARSNPAEISASNVIDFELSNFDYLEFDIKYNAPLQVNLVTSAIGKNYGRVSTYSTNGDAKMRWHHIILPLKGVTGKFDRLDFTSFGDAEAVFVADNVVLTPKLGSSTSKNYYCTGGFQGWVDNMDPPSTLTDLSWTNIGPYAFVCNAQGSFGWTGSRCCGDDTKKANYGEFYNDTEGACFNGSVVRSDMSMGTVKNIYESNLLSEDELKNYDYSGILFFNSSFFGCQVPNNDINLKVALAGVATSNNLIDNNNYINSQCTVVGSYYCANGVWRKKILVSESDMPVDFDSTKQNITLKMIPSGPELIKNGFRG
jgi:hypothetical protein